jgi:integrase
MKTVENVDTLAATVVVGKRTVSIRRYQVGGVEEFRFPYYVDGKRRYKCLRTLHEAKTEAQQVESLESQRAPRSSVALQGTVITDEIAKIIAQAVGQAQPVRVSVPFDQIVDRYIANQEERMTRGEIRWDSLRSVFGRLARLKTQIGSVGSDQMTAALLDQAIRGLGVNSPRSTWNFRCDIRAVVSWGIRHDMAPVDALRGWKNMSIRGDSRKNSEKINPFTAEEVEVFLNACLSGGRSATDRNYRLAAAIALQAFCGLRQKESTVLKWEQIDLDAGVIRILAGGSKVKRNRTVDIPDNARVWLELTPYQIRQGKIYSGNYFDGLHWAKKRAIRVMPTFAWKSNGLRSAFISHFIARCDSIAETAYIAGTSESKIRTNYWRLKTKEDASRYFSIVPGADA